MRQGDLIGGVASDGGGAFGQFEGVNSLAGFVYDSDPVRGRGLHVRILRRVYSIKARWKRHPISVLHRQGHLAIAICKDVGHDGLPGRGGKIGRGLNRSWQHRRRNLQQRRQAGQVSAITQQGGIDDDATGVRRNSEGMNWLLKHDISFAFDAGTKKSGA